MKLLGSAITASQVIDPGIGCQSVTDAHCELLRRQSRHQLINHLQHQLSVRCIELGQLLAEHNALFGGAVAGLTQEVCKLTHRLPLANGQVVLFELHSGGVACPVLYQLAVAQTGALTMLSQPFGTCSDEGKLTPAPNGFTLDLPGNPGQRWVWDASSLTLRKQS